MDVKHKQRAVIEFPLFKCCEGNDMVLRLQNAYGRDTSCRASVFKWTNEIRGGSDELRNEGLPRKSYCYETDAALRSILWDDPNGSLWTITDRLLILSETVRTYMSRIDHTLKSLRWISHALTSDLEQIYFDLCLQLLPKLRAHAHNNWRYLVTGDETWFYYKYVRDRIWTARDEKTPDVENRVIACTKSMLTVLWNPQGFHVVTMLPPGELSNASWFIDQNLLPLVQSFFPSGWSPRQQE
jgi:hypothetical protein